MLRFLLSLLYPPGCLGCQGLLLGKKGPFCPSCSSHVQAITPPLCPCCGTPFASGEDHLCGRCLTLPPAFRQARAWASYAAAVEETNPLAQALYRFKYARELSIGKELAKLAASHFPLSPQTYHLILPVPLHLSRLRWRGFNQALILAQALAQRYSLPIDPFSLQRVRATNPQVGLKEEERRKNVRGAFAVVRPEKIAGKGVLLVDDVYTTGATANECARALLAAGASYVDVFTLARAVLQ